MTIKITKKTKSIKKLSLSSGTPRKDNDTPWKNIVHAYFDDCIAFFFPEVASRIDWSIRPQFRDGELQKITVDGDSGRRIVDVLAEVQLLNGSKTAILLHLEIQGDRVEAFPERIFTYYARIFDRYKTPVMTLAILTDDDPSWRPQYYEYHCLGFQVHMTFPMAKLLDYQNQQAALAENENPFALVVLARLASIASKKSPDGGLEAKITLTRHLYTLAKSRGKNKEFVRNLFNVIDFLLALPPPRALEYQALVHTIEKEMQMPYLSSIEQLAKQQGIQQGVQQGIQQGVQQGIQQGMQKGSQEMQRGIASNLLREGMDLESIVRLTDMPLEELRTLTH